MCNYGCALPANEQEWEQQKQNRSGHQPCNSIFNIPYGRKAIMNLMSGCGVDGCGELKWANIDSREVQIHSLKQRTIVEVPEMMNNFCTWKTIDTILYRFRCNDGIALHDCHRLSNERDLSFLFFSFYKSLTIYLDRHSTQKEQINFYLQFLNS